MHHIPPQVSVILPTFNRASELPRSITSVLCQTFTDFELIVVDDASTDDTENVVKAFGDERIRYERLSSNVGGAEARNVGIRLARGEYIAFQDSDDEWRCHKLDAAVRELKASPKVGAVFSAFIQVWDSGCRRMPIWSGLDPQDSFYQSLLWRNFVGTPTLVAKKSLLEEIGGFDRAMPRYQDWELVLRLARVTEFAYLPDPLVISHVTEGSISHDQEAHVRALQMLYEKHRGAITQHPPLRSSWLYRLGDAKMVLGQRDGRRLLLRAIRGNFFNLRYLVKGLLSLPGNKNLYNRARRVFGKRA